MGRLEDLTSLNRTLSGGKRSRNAAYKQEENNGEQRCCKGKRKQMSEGGDEIHVVMRALPESPKLERNSSFLFEGGLGTAPWRDDACPQSFQSPAFASGGDLNNVRGQPFANQHLQTLVDKRTGIS